VLEASCHCGAVRIELPRKPRSLTSCNCSICRRYGTLWAYYRAPDVRLVAARGATEAYAYGSQSIRFVRCATCGCVTHWEEAAPGSGRMGINSRLMDPVVTRGVPVRLLDGAKSWKALGRGAGRVTL
jgi:hypothetical protein